MTSRARLLLSLLVPAALGGCAALEFIDDQADGGTDTTVPMPDPELEGELPDEAFEVAGRIGDLLIDTMPEPWDPSASRPRPPQAVESDPASAPAAANDCPYMPTFGLARPRVRRTFDWDSIRALDPEVADSLGEAGALPRGDSVVAFPDRGPATRMPTVPIDSAGHPIRVAPLCRVTGTGR